MKIAKRICFVLMLLTGANLLFSFVPLGVSLITILPFLARAFNPWESSAVGIIGGADGPTAIYTTNGMPFGVYLLINAGLFALFLAAWLVLRHQLKKK